MTYQSDTLHRLLQKTVRLPWSGCQIFTGSLDTSGYGLIGVGGSGNIRKAHRVSYELQVGPIPDGLQVLHVCDVRCCVNTAHLFLGTIQDNMDDRGRKGRQFAHRGMMHSRHKLTDKAIPEIIARYRAGEKPDSICKDYGVTRHAIDAVINGTTWKHITKGIL